MRALVPCTWGRGDTYPLAGSPFALLASLLAKEGGHLVRGGARKGALHQLLHTGPGQVGNAAQSFLEHEALCG